MLVDVVLEVIKLDTHDACHGALAVLVEVTPELHVRITADLDRIERVQAVVPLDPLVAEPEHDQQSDGGQHAEGEDLQHRRSHVPERCLPVELERIVTVHPFRNVGRPVFGHSLPDDSHSPSSFRGAGVVQSHSRPSHEGLWEQVI